MGIRNFVGGLAFYLAFAGAVGGLVSPLEAVAGGKGGEKEEVISRIYDPKGKRREWVVERRKDGVDGSTYLVYPSLEGFENRQVVVRASGCDGECMEENVREVSVSPGGIDRPGYVLIRGTDGKFYRASYSQGGEISERSFLGSNR